MSAIVNRHTDRETVTDCPSCGKRKWRYHYLCGACWHALPDASRSALSYRDARATLRLIQLHRQLNDGVPVHEIRIEVEVSG